ncbi:MAG TPA: hypothetical protein VFB60_14810 [Ktedonobacteraceae bacterium]|nr:hypothetical protein [Ktedonobacteraceae bacterium]
MGKQKRNKSRSKRYTVHLPHMGLVTFPPSRRSSTPFCAYYGPKGETCSQVTELEMVFILPSIPPVKYMACPLHYDAVDQVVQRFIARMEHLAQQM